MTLCQSILENGATKFLVTGFIYKDINMLDRPTTVELFISMMNDDDGNHSLFWWEPEGEGYRIALHDGSEWYVKQTGNEIRATKLNK